MALHHAEPNEIVPLAAEMQNEAGRVSLAKTAQFQAMHVSLKKDESIPAHHVEGYATVLCLRGSVEMILADKTVRMNSGDWLYLDQGQEHAVHSHDESALLVTIMLST